MSQSCLGFDSGAAMTFATFFTRSSPREPDEYYAQGGDFG
jgi:hypothetical protein